MESKQKKVYRKCGLGGGMERWNRNKDRNIEKNQG